MVLPCLLLFFLALSAGVYYWFTRLKTTADLWRTAARLALALAASRTGCALLGGFILENTSSWIQIPAYFLAMLALPEAALASALIGRPWPSPLLLAGLLTAGSFGWVFGIAGLAFLRRKRMPPTH